MNRIKYVDTLKFLAIFSIILLHIFGIWGDVGIVDKLDFNHLKQFVIFGVPLFLMITGMLTLNKEIDLEIFFKKKFVRIIYPLVFFFVIAFVANVYSDFFTSFWYCWIIIAVYLAIPVINVFIKNAHESDLEYFIVIFLISSAIYTIAQKLGFKLALDLDFFIGPVSFVILGYYLSKKDFKTSSNKIILGSLILFILISIFKVRFSNVFYINSNDVVVSYLNFDLPSVIQTSSLFVFFKYLYSSSDGLTNKVRMFLERDFVNSIMLSISRSSYGIYLFHMILFRGYIEPYFQSFKLTPINAFISVWIISILLLIVSWLVILILGKIPLINKLSGYY